jgi:hypothetical protein
MAINVHHVALYEDSWGQGRIDKSRDIIGMDIKTVNIEVELAGPDFPSEVEVSIRTREPNNKSGGNATVKNPVTVKLPRAGNSKWYLLNLPLNKLVDFMALEKNCNEVTTIVREKGTADNEFTKPMYGKGWARRGMGKQPPPRKRFPATRPSNNLTPTSSSWPAASRCSRLPSTPSRVYSLKEGSIGALRAVPPTSSSTSDTAPGATAISSRIPATMSGSTPSTCWSSGAIPLWQAAPWTPTASSSTAATSSIGT